MRLEQIKQIQAEIEVFNASEECRQDNPHELAYLLTPTETKLWLFKTIEIISLRESLIYFIDKNNSKLILPLESILAVIVNQQEDGGE